MNTEALKQTEHALRQANRAAKKGDLVAAERWSKTAERLAAALETVSTAHAGEAEHVRLNQQLVEELMCDMFAKAAYLANVMLHSPARAPGAFQGLIKLWREQNLGEGEADAERAAAKLAEAQAAFLDGRFEETLPAYVRERLVGDWERRRDELKDSPVIPRHWE